ncbi:MAG: hypothetical protein UHD09_06725 [Bifidobacterium sp.]|nr:hypothetical protein [Bifidobacterium sp.]
MWALELFGSVLYVKTMIRERGSKRYLAASWIWHLLLCAAGLATSPWFAALGVILLARAVALPLIAMRRRVRPKVTGIVESVTSVLAFVLILCWALFTSF